MLRHSYTYLHSLTENYSRPFIFRSDPLDRYYVVFDADERKRIIPPDGVIPISMLTNSTKVHSMILNTVNYIACILM